MTIACAGPNLTFLQARLDRTLKDRLRESLEKIA
jgi:hypothetical protein